MTCRRAGWRAGCTPGARPVRRLPRLPQWTADDLRQQSSRAIVTSSCSTCASPESGPPVTSTERATSPALQLPRADRRDSRGSADCRRCSSGYRSSVAASVLARHGHTAVAERPRRNDGVDQRGLPRGRRKVSDAPEFSPTRGGWSSRPQTRRDDVAVLARARGVEAQLIAREVVTASSQALAPALPYHHHITTSWAARSAKCLILRIADPARRLPSKEPRGRRGSPSGQPGATRNLGGRYTDDALCHGVRRRGERGGQADLTWTTSGAWWSVSVATSAAVVGTCWPIHCPPSAHTRRVRASSGSARARADANGGITPKIGIASGVEAADVTVEASRLADEAPPGHAFIAEAVHRGCRTRAAARGISRRRTWLATGRVKPSRRLSPVFHRAPHGFRRQRRTARSRIASSPASFGRRASV